jgi:hypothetical protein
MRRTTLLRRCTWISVAAAFALAWVNYWAMLAGFALVCVSLTAYLIAQDVEQ